MSMTQKDFEAIAAVIKDAHAQLYGRGNPVDEGAAIGIRIVARRIANVCANANPRFDRNRFIDACGITANVNDVPPIVAQCMVAHGQDPEQD